MGNEDRLVSGRYRLVERVGSGAMGVVWRARDELLGRTVAIKQLTPPPNPSAMADDSSERARREARIAARVRHPNAVTLYDVVEDGGLPWLVMEYVPSRSLAAALAESGPMPPREVARIGALVASALSAAHRVGVVHRDVKPGNVLLGNDGAVKIADFGISRAVDDVVLTSTGIIAGTPAFLSPEMARGGEPTAASDVFALGATLYAAVEGEPPFGLGDSALALLHAVASGRVRAPRRAGPLERGLMLLLRPDPADRPSMAEAETLLAGVTEGAPPPAAFAVPGPPPPVTATTRLERTERAWPFAQTAVTPPSHAPSATGGARTGRRFSTPLVAVALTVAAAVVALGVVLGSSALSTGADHQAADSPPAGGPASSAADIPATSTPTGPDTASSAPSASGPPATPTATAARPPEDLRKFITKYYSLVPSHLTQAWAMLSPRYQAQTGGFARYQRFWNTIARVRTRDVTPTGDHTVTATLVFTRKDGTVTVEHYGFTTTTVGGTLVIDDAGIIPRRFSGT